MPQNLYYVSNYDACIALGAILNYKSWDQATTEITYTVTDDQISLNGYANYSRTLGAFWTDDLTLQVYGEWNTVFTLKEEKHYDVVTPPAGLATTTYPFSTTINASTPYETTVEVGWDGDDVYIKGLLSDVPDGKLRRLRRRRQFQERVGLSLTNRTTETGTASACLRRET